MSPRSKMTCHVLDDKRYGTRSVHVSLQYCIMHQVYLKRCVQNIVFYLLRQNFTQKDFLIMGCAVFNAVNIWRRRINLYAFRINEYFNDKERIALGKGIIKYLIYCALYVWPTFRAMLSCTARNNQKTNFCCQIQLWNLLLSCQAIKRGKFLKKLGFYAGGRA